VFAATGRGSFRILFACLCRRSRRTPAPRPGTTPERRFSLFARAKATYAFHAVRVACQSKNAAAACADRKSARIQEWGAPCR
jgi:hypothetical protein